MLQNWTILKDSENSLPKRMLLVSINRCRFPYPVFPLGTAHLAGALRHNGYETKILDMIFESENLEKEIDAFKPDFVGLSLRNIDDIRIDKTRFFVPDLEEVHKRIRAVSTVPVILGGSAFSLFPVKLLEFSGVDYGLVGESEGSLVMLLDKLTKAPQKPSGLENIPGLVYRNGNLVLQNPVQNLPASGISIPERSKNLTDYYISSTAMMNVQTQRGCPYSCCYCTYPLIEGKKVRLRSPQSVVTDMKAAAKSGCRYFFVVDSVFNTSNDHVRGICEELIREKLDLHWGCFLRPSGLTPELMRLMSLAGLKHIEFGSDSFCDEVLYSYGKNFTFDDVLASSEMARKEKIHYSHFLIIGGPGETESTILKTYQNSLKLRKTVIFPFTGMRLYPGTSLHVTAIQEKLIKEESDLLEPFFYISPQIKKERISELLAQMHAGSPRWLIEDPPEEQIRVMDSLRKKGITGPLWEFLAS